MPEFLINCLWVGAGGFIGSILRYTLGLIPVSNANGFPLMTLIINVVGAFAIGLIMAYAAKQIDFSEHLLLFLKVGICGGFTTFSAFSLESTMLFDEGKYLIVGLYVALSVVLCIAAVFAGNALVGTTAKSA